MIRVLIGTGRALLPEVLLPRVQPISFTAVIRSVTIAKPVRPVHRIADSAQRMLTARTIRARTIANRPQIRRTVAGREVIRIRVISSICGNDRVSVPEEVVMNSAPLIDCIVVTGSVMHHTRVVGTVPEIVAAAEEQMLTVSHIPVCMPSSQAKTIRQAVS